MLRARAASRRLSERACSPVDLAAVEIVDIPPKQQRRGAIYTSKLGKLNFLTLKTSRLTEFSSRSWYAPVVLRSPIGAERRRPTWAALRACARVVTASYSPDCLRRQFMDMLAAKNATVKLFASLVP